MNIIQFMLDPFLACVILIGIHGYFGIHVLKREIIFIDIAMAQIAVLGITVAILFNIESESNWAYLFSVGFTTLVAALFAYIKDEKLVIPLEAIIGLSYAISTTATILIIDRVAGAAEHIQEMLIGSILWVTRPEILKSFLAYAIIGVIHYIFREKFIAISENSKTAKTSGINVKMWDFLFYATLGIVVIHSVRIGGILVVFAFLVIPASISTLFTRSWFARIVIAWTVGTLVSVVGLYCSWQLDLPTGPVVILALGIVLFCAMILKKIIPAKSP